MIDNDDLPKFERFRTRRKPSTAQRRALGQQKCLHKKAYYTAGKAQQAAARQMSFGAPPLSVYHCPNCPFWHLTHKV